MGGARRLKAEDARELTSASRSTPGGQLVAQAPASSASVIAVQARRLADELVKTGAARRLVEAGDATSSGCRADLPRRQTPVEEAAADCTIFEVGTPASTKQVQAEPEQIRLAGTETKIERFLLEPEADPGLKNWRPLVGGRKLLALLGRRWKRAGVLLRANSTQMHQADWVRRSRLFDEASTSRPPRTRQRRWTRPCTTSY